VSLDLDVQVFYGQHFGAGSSASAGSGISGLSLDPLISTVTLAFDTESMLDGRRINH